MTEILRIQPLWESGDRLVAGRVVANADDDRTADPVGQAGSGFCEISRTTLEWIAIIPGWWLELLEVEGL